MSDEKYKRVFKASGYELDYEDVSYNGILPQYKDGKVWKVFNPIADALQLLHLINYHHIEVYWGTDGLCTALMKGLRGFTEFTDKDLEVAVFEVVNNYLLIDGGDL